jgi:hypothetical protein
MSNFKPSDRTALRGRLLSGASAVILASMIAGGAHAATSTVTNTPDIYVGTAASIQDITVLSAITSGLTSSTTNQSNYYAVTDTVNSTTNSVSNTGGLTSTSAAVTSATLSASALANTYTTAIDLTLISGTNGESIQSTSLQNNAFIETAGASSTAAATFGDTGKSTTTVGSNDI